MKWYEKLIPERQRMHKDPYETVGIIKAIKYSTTYRIQNPGLSGGTFDSFLVTNLIISSELGNVSVPINGYLPFEENQKVKLKCERIRRESTKRKTRTIRYILKSIELENFKLNPPIQDTSYYESMYPTIKYEEER